MANTANIKIWGQPVGSVAWDPETGVATFEYARSFLTSGLDLSPLLMPLSDGQSKGFSFPELRRSATFKGIPGLLADVLPDKYGNALIDAWLIRNKRPTGSLNPVEMLCFIGKRGMGAMEFEPQFPKGGNTSTHLEIADLVEVANHILSGRKSFITKVKPDEEKALVDILKIGTSAGGARAKAVIAYNAQTGEVRSGQANVPKNFTHWLIKFDGVSDAQFGATHGYGRVEMAYHLMANAAQIEMTECRLLEENGRAHFMTRRFDREGDNEKIHVQSLCALRHFDFNDVGLHSYEQLFETMRMLGLPYPQAEQVFRRMVFNVLARNCDDHTKNTAFLMNMKGEWKLSPAFDVCHSYRPGSDWVSMQSMSVNGKRKKIGRDDFLAVAKSMNIKKATSIIEHVNDVIQHWDAYAKEVEVDKKLAGAIGKTLLSVCP
jgi:serine/threonine-protein kinase HipA